MVQLVSLMYRDQQQGTIRKLINEWLESSLAESSEDDENNPMSSSSSVSPKISVRHPQCQIIPVVLYYLGHFLCVFLLFLICVMNAIERK